MIAGVAAGAALLVGAGWLLGASGGRDVSDADRAVSPDSGIASGGSDEAPAGIAGDPEPSGSDSPAPPQSPPAPPGDGKPEPGGPADAAGSVRPAAPGERLERLEAPPDRSLWAMTPESCDADVAVRMVFEPYGIGPGSLGPSVVVRVVSASASDPSAKLPELAGKNVVLVLGGVRVETGGAWEGTAMTRLRDGQVILELQEARRSKDGS